MIRLVSSLAALTLVGACAKDPTAGKSKAAVAAPVAERPPAAGGETLAITSSSGHVGFVGAKVTAQHVGSFSDFGGSIVLVDGKPEKSRVELEVRTASVSIEGGPQKLVNHLKSPDFFDVATYPEARFVSTEIRPGSDVAGATHTVTGNLELRGTRKSVTFPATIAVTPGAVAVKAEFGIDRKDFGIVYPGVQDDLIKDNVLIRIDLSVPRAAAKS